MDRTDTSSACTGRRWVRGA